MATKTRIVKIGNSWGIRIPKRLLDEATATKFDREEWEWR